MRAWLRLSDVLVLVAPAHVVELDHQPTIPLEVVRIVQPNDERVTQLPAVRRRYAIECLERGDVAYFAMSEGSLVGWVWATAVSHRDPSTRLPISLSPGQVYAYDGWVLAGHRRHGVFQEMFRVLFADQAARPAVTAVVSYVLASNDAIRRALVPFGYVEVQRARFLVVLVRYGIRLPFTTRPRTRGPMRWRSA